MRWCSPPYSVLGAHHYLDKARFGCKVSDYKLALDNQPPTHAS